MKCFKKNLADLFTWAKNNETFFKYNKSVGKFFHKLGIHWYLLGLRILLSPRFYNLKKVYGRCFLNICILLSFICKFFNKNLAKLCIQHPNTNKKNFYHPKPILSWIPMSHWDNSFFFILRNYRARWTICRGTLIKETKIPIWHFWFCSYFLWVKGNQRI